MAQELAKDKHSVLFEKNGMLHCGAEIVPAETVRKLKAPDPKGRWHPVRHIDVSDCATEHLAIGGYEVKQQVHSLTHDGARWFSLLEVETSHDDGGGELSRIIGLRNTHDKSFRAQVVTGTGVFVCDNLSFSGEINVGRKHTTHILRDMPILMGKVVGALAGVLKDSERRIEAYKERELSREEVHDIVCLAMEQGHIPTSKIKPILSEYKHPRNECFAPNDDGRGTAWTFFNAFTEIGKAFPMHGGKGGLQKRTMGMNGLLDSYCDLEIRPQVIDAEELVITEDENADLIVTT